MCQVPSQSKPKIPEEHDLEASFALAMQKAKVWPCQLISALDAGHLMGRGLVLCVVDARAGQADKIELHAPVATHPKLVGLCEKLCRNQLVLESIKQFEAHLPRAAAAAFQFIPTDVWKSHVQQSFPIQISRSTLKGTKAVTLLVWFMLPAARALLPVTLMGAGATMSSQEAAKLSAEEKAAIWTKFAHKSLDLNESLHMMMRSFVGLDPVALKEEPLFQHLLGNLRQHVERWCISDEYQTLSLLKAWKPQDNAVAKGQEAFVNYMLDFFAAHEALVRRLQSTMGPKRMADMVALAAANFDREEECKLRYTSSFCRCLSPPCVSCGRPLEREGCYLCPCQRPALPGPALQQQPAQAKAPSLVTTTLHSNGVKSFHRKKNIQTSFTMAEQRKKNGGSKHVAAREAEPSTPINKVAPVNRAPAAKKKSTKKQNPEIFQPRHIMQQHGEPAGPRNQEDPATSASGLWSSRRRARRSRRTMPQGDNKLARMLAAGELLIEGHHEGRDAADS